MINLKDKLLTKSLEITKKDLLRMNELISLDITEKYSNRNQLKNTLKELMDEVELAAVEKKKISFINQELSQTLQLNELEVEKALDKFLFLKDDLKKKAEYRERLENEIEKKSKRQSDLEKETKMFEREVSSLSIQLDSKKKIIEELAESLNLVENEYNNKSTHAKSLNESFLKIDSDHHNMSNQLVLDKAKLEKLKSEFLEKGKNKVELEQKLKDIMLETSHVREDILSAESEISQKLEEISHINSLFKNQEIELSKHSIEREKMLAKISDLSESQLRIDELVNSSLLQKKEAEEELLKLDEKKIVLEKHLQKKNQEFNKLKVREGIHEQLLLDNTSEYDEVYSLYCEKKSELENLKESITELRKELSVRDISKLNLKEDINLIEVKIDNTQKEIIDIKNSIKTNERVENSLSDEKYFKNERLQKEVRYLNTLNESLDKLKYKKNSLEDDNSLLDDEISNKCENILSIKKDRARLLEKLKNTNEIRYNLEKRIISLNSDIADEKRVLNNTNKELDKVNLDVNILHNEIESHESLIRDIENQINKKKSIRLKTQESIDDLYFTIEEKDQEIDQLKIVLGDESFRNKKIDEKRVKTESIIIARNEALDRVKESISLTQKENENLSKSNEELKTEAYSYLEKLKSERIFLRSLLELKEAEGLKAQALNRKKRGLVKNISMTSISINEIHEEIESLKELFSSEDLALEKLEAKYAGLQMNLIHYRKNTEDINDEVQKCQTKKLELQQTIKELELKISTESKEVTSIDEEELNSLRKEVSELLENLASTRTIYTEEVSKKRSLYSQVDLLKKKRENVLNDLLEVEKQLSLEKSDNSKKGDEMISLSEEVYFIKENLNSKKEMLGKKNKYVIKRPSRDA